MKYLFFVLLLANIVFYLWETGLGQPPQPQATEASAAGERIVLIEELPAPPLLQTAEPAVQRADASVPPAQQGTENPPPDAPATPTPPAQQSVEIRPVDAPATPTPPAQQGVEIRPVDAPATPTPPAQQGVEIRPPDAPATPVPPAQQSVENPPPAAPPAPVPPGQPQQTAAAETAIQPGGTAAATPEQAQTCRQLGPYLSLRQAQAALSALGSPPGAIKPVKKPTLAENGYLILYPAADSPEAAQANRKMLATKGHADAWVVEQGENRYAISLAVVNGKERAEEAAGRFRAQGIVVELKPRMAMVNRWWLEARNEADRTALEASVGNDVVAVKACD